MDVSRLVLLTAVLTGPLSAAWADMSPNQGSFPLAVHSFGTATAQLDLGPARALRDTSPWFSQAAGSSASSRSPLSRPDLLPTDLVSSGLCRIENWADSPFATRGAVGSIARETIVHELPQLPGSASLFLSALMSVGAWQAVRRASHLHITHVPEWYHPDAPHQIGHSVASDPTLGFGLLTVCSFDAPIEADPSPVLGYPRDALSRCQSPHFLTIETPRGPPAPAA